MAKRESKKMLATKKNIKKVQAKLMEEKMSGETVNNQEEKVTEEDINPQEVIDTYTKAMQSLDSKITLETTTEDTVKVLEEELKKAEEIEASVKKVIEKKEKEVNKTNAKKKDYTKIWNGIIDGWFN